MKGGWLNDALDPEHLFRSPAFFVEEYLKPICQILLHDLFSSDKKLIKQAIEDMESIGMRPEDFGIDRELLLFYMDIK